MCNLRYDFVAHKCDKSIAPRRLCLQAPCLRDTYTIKFSFLSHKVLELSLSFLYSLMDEVKLLIDLMGHKNSEYVRNQMFCYFENLTISYNGSELASYIINFYSS